MAGLEYRGNHVFLNGKDIGEQTKLADGTKVYITHRQRAPHFCIKHQGWGIALEEFNALKQDGFQEIQIRVGAFETFSSKIELWDKYGEIDQLRSDYEVQIFLAEVLMKKTKLTMAQLTG